jgi:hypothetical protein
MKAKNKNAKNAPAPAAIAAAAAGKADKPKGGPAWDSNFTEADRALVAKAVDAVLGVDSAERSAAAAFGDCYTANLHGKAGFSDFGRWATAAGEAAGLPEKARSSVYRLVNAGVALAMGKAAGEDLSDIPSPTLAAILGTARKEASDPAGVPAHVRTAARVYRSAKGRGLTAKAAEAEATGKASSTSAKPENREDRAKAVVSAVMRLSDSWTERENALADALAEIKRLRKVANA